METVMERIATVMIAGTGRPAAVILPKYAMYI
jgi:hypothetical protein